MKLSNRWMPGMALIVIVLAIAIMIPAIVTGQQGGRGGQGPGGQGQGPGGGGGGRGGQQAPPANLPQTPTAVTLPTVSAQVTGPGAMYESVQSLAPGKGLANFKYEAREYFISGTANGQPYKTRIVVRRPTSDATFNGLVLVEPMHPSGSAHMFEFTSVYGMSTGYIAVEIVAGGIQGVIDFNKERYKDFAVQGAQTSEIIAQVGALIKSKQSGNPLSALAVRKIVLGGTSATAGTLIQYLPAHAVYRTPDMQRIFDGFFPTSNGAQIAQTDVAMIHVPTMLEVRQATITSRQDGDEAGNQYRVYEFPGMGHIDSRDNDRLHPNPCKNPNSNFLTQAYMSVAFHHLVQWVDKGIVPPKADRIWKDRNEANDGSSMLLDENGNPRGGVRNTYVDVPIAKYSTPNEGAVPLIANPSAYVAARGQAAANQMCGLAAYQIDLTKAQLKQLYGNPKTYRSRVEKRLVELEKAGWSLPVYREMILADAAKIEF